MSVGWVVEHIMKSVLSCSLKEATANSISNTYDYSKTALTLSTWNLPKKYCKYTIHKKEILVFQNNFSRLKFNTFKDRH